MARFNNTTTSNEKDVYGIIHDSFTNAKNAQQLQAAVEAAIPMMQAARLDKYAQEQLEAYGKKRFYQIEEELRHMSYIVKSNRKN